jgi:RND family efflux transporter MFP subunit
MERTLHLVAEFRSFREIDVIAKVSGYVSRINVDIGDRVNTGQVLATLEVPEMADDQTRAAAALERAVAEVARAREEVRRTESASKIAQLNFERLSNVAKQRPGLIAQQELDNASARALETSAQYAGAKSALSAAEHSVKVLGAEQSRVNTLLNYTRVVAPFPGVITRRYAEVGAMVQAGISSQTNVLPIVHLAQDNVLRLDLPIPESAVPYVRVGFPVQISVPTLNRTIDARIDRFSSQLQTSTRTMTAQIDVNNADFSIKPGMFADVLFQFESKSAALVAPLMALDGAGEARRALRILPDGSLAAVTVNIGAESSEDAEILSGLNEGDVLVLAGRNQLRPGMKVTPKLTQTQGGAR